MQVLLIFNLSSIELVPPKNIFGVSNWEVFQDEYWDEIDIPDPYLFR